MSMNLIETLFIEITTNCNLHCIHCGYKNKLPKTIPFDSIKKAITRCLQYGLKTVVLTGGEPTLHPDLLEILRYCKQYNLNTKITTNGNNLASLLHCFKDNIVDQVVVSLDASTNTTYKKIRGSDKFTEIWQDIKRLSEFNDKIGCSFLIQKTNYKELLPFLQMCAENETTVSLLVPHNGSDFTYSLQGKEYSDVVFLSQEDIKWFQNNVVNKLILFYEQHKEMFKFSKNHLDAIIRYVTSEKERAEVRTTVCSLPLRTLFLYSDQSVRLCPYHSECSYRNIDLLIDDLVKARMKFIFKCSQKGGACKKCLEVPLE